MLRGHIALTISAVTMIAACSSSSSGSVIVGDDSGPPDTADGVSEAGDSGSVEDTSLYEGGATDAAPLCTIHALGPTDGAVDASTCFSCVAMKCASWDTQCTADPACSAQFDCMYACKPPSVACKHACQAQHPSPIADCYFDCMDWDCGYACW